ncbi:hypothetical protein ACFQV2_36980 [Actinokineospora soli]|uniref:Uncharacterized protein n=1 Tax=Actinokineospora soli TaxID=1048753 RepID=A0ABW2TZH1_9PSEU
MRAVVGKTAVALLAALALAGCGPTPGSAPTEADLREIESTLDAVEAELAGD